MIYKENNLGYYKVISKENGKKKIRQVEATDSFDALLLVLKYAHPKYIKVIPVDAKSK